MRVGFDRKHKLIDFYVERGEDHAAFSIAELEDLVREAKEDFR